MCSGWCSSCWPPKPSGRRLGILCITIRSPVCCPTCRRWAVCCCWAGGCARIALHGRPPNRWWLRKLEPAQGRELDMTARTKITVGLAFGVIALTTVALVFLHKIQRLGQPGVRLVNQNVLQEDGVIIGTNTVPLPEQILNYESKVQPIAKVVTGWLPKDTTYAQRVYRAPDQFWIQVNVVLMGADRTSIHKPEYCLAGQGFQTTKVERDTLRIAEPHPYDLPLLKMTV